MSLITVYTKPSCVQCTAVKRYLGIRHAEAPVEWVDLTLEHNQDVLDSMRQRGLLQAPITQIGDVLIPGFDPDAITAAIAATHIEEAA